MSPSPHWVNRHVRSLKWASAIVPIAVVSIGLVGFWQFIPVTFSGSGQTLPAGTSCIEPCPPMGAQSLPSSVTVTLSWSVQGGDTVSFYVEENPPLGAVAAEPRAILCRAEASNGTCAFVSAGFTYGFYASTGTNSTVIVSWLGTYDTSMFESGKI